MFSAPAMTITRMIGDGLEKGFVSWWLGGLVWEKTSNITQDSPTTYRQGAGRQPTAGAGESHPRP